MLLYALQNVDQSDNFFYCAFWGLGKLNTIAQKNIGKKATEASENQIP